MDYTHFVNKIENAYAFINEKVDAEKDRLVSLGYFDTQVKFEDIDLSEILESDLVPLILPMLDYCNINNQKLLKKIYKVYIATLCEIVKNGLSEGGILKQIKINIGSDFDTNRHYSLLNRAFESENIDFVTYKGHKYEATIIFEAGIPRNLHRDAFLLFKTYWKWTKGYDKNDRRKLIGDFIDQVPIPLIFIPDPSDYRLMKNLRDRMQNFSEKLLKTCFRLEDIFSEFDEYPEIINKNNINYVCDFISKSLNYNVKAVIRFDEIENEFINYSNHVSFAKFDKILNNISADEKIHLPNGMIKTRLTYKFENYFCGTHIIDGLKLEVFYPIGIGPTEIVKNYPLNKIEYISNAVLYISKDDFEVHINGLSKIVRRIIYGKNTYYIYWGKIPDASIAYIDDKCIQSELDTVLNAEIRKRFNKESNKHELFVFIKNCTHSNKLNSMKKLAVSVGKNRIERLIVNGYKSIVNKDIPISINSATETITIDVSIDDATIKSKEYKIEDFYVFSYWSGIEISSPFDFSQTFNNRKVIIFSKKYIDRTNVSLEQLENSQGFYVYYSEIDEDLDEVYFDDRIFKFKQHKSEYLDYEKIYKFSGNTPLFEYNYPIFIKIKNIIHDIRLYHLDVFHNGNSQKFIFNEYSKDDKFDMRQFFLKELDNTGLWRVSLYYEQLNLSEIVFIIVPRLTAKPTKNLYLAGELVEFEISSDSFCFLNEDKWTNKIILDGENASLDFADNLITSHPIELQVYLDSCEIFQTIEPPQIDVWDVFDYDEKQRKPTLLTHKQFSTDKPDSDSILVCSTKNAQLDFKHENYSIKRNINSGYNFIPIQTIIRNWKAVNNVNISFGNGPEKKVVLLFEPKINLLKYIVKSNYIHAIFNFYGPIKTEIVLTSFFKNERINIQKYTTSRNQYELSIDIPYKNNHINGEILVECSFDEQDSFAVGKFVVKDISVLETIQLKNYINIQNLVEKSLIDSQKISLNTNISELLLR